MQIAICDDDRIHRMIIKDYIRQYSEKNPDVNITCDLFENAYDLEESLIKTGGYDIYLLDILMPDINGIELGALIRSSDSSGKIIYLTSSEEHAIAAFKVKAFDYLLKPVEKDAFFRVMDDAVSTFASQDSRSVTVKTRDGMVKLDTEHITYAELCQRCVVYHMLNGTEVESVTIRSTFSSAVAELLSDHRFTLGGTSLAVNLSCITSVENDTVHFKCGNSVYLSKKAFRDVRSKWCSFWFIDN